MTESANNIGNPNGSASENLALGAVWVWRSMRSKAWYKKSDYVHLFLHLLLSASYKGYETWFNGSSVTLQPGQLVTGRKKLSEQTGINEHKVDRILKTFEREQQIEQQTSSTSRLITILNWSTYQNIAQQNTQRVSNERATGEQRVSTIQEGLKKEKKVKKVKEPSLPDTPADNSQNKDESEPYWKSLISTWVSFYKKKKSEDPTITGRECRELKSLIGLLKTRADKKGVEWTEENALSRFSQFLERAYSDPWLSKNFLLSNLVKQFDKIVASHVNGINGAGITPQVVKTQNGKSAGAVQLIELLKAQEFKPIHENQNLM